MYCIIAFLYYRVFILAYLDKYVVDNYLSSVDVDFDINFWHCVHFFGIMKMYYAVDYVRTVTVMVAA